MDVLVQKMRFVELVEINDPENCRYNDDRNEDPQPVRLAELVEMFLYGRSVNLPGLLFFDLFLWRGLMLFCFFVHFVFGFGRIPHGSEVQNNKILKKRPKKTGMEKLRIEYDRSLFPFSPNLLPLPLNAEFMIIAKDIRKRYGDLQVLKGISLKVEDGEIISIVGASGAGKSTLLHIIGTLDRPESGEVSFDGIQVQQLPEKKLAECRNKHIVFVFQFHHLLPEFTALENICIPAFIARKSRKEAAVRAEELLEFMGLTARRNHKPSELSGGEAQRIAVARALVNNPSVVLADEPSGNLDSASAVELHNLFFQLRDTFRQTYIIVTHNTELADKADRKLTIRDGII